MNQELSEFPYKDKECYVFTRSSIKSTEHVTFVNGDVTEFVQELKKKDGKDIWMEGGGELLHSFLQNGLIDEIIITLAPTILVSGIRLFKEGDYQLDLIFKGMRRFNQFVELRYSVKK